MSRKLTFPSKLTSPQSPGIESKIPCRKKTASSGPRRVGMLLAFVKIPLPSANSSSSERSILKPGSVVLVEVIVNAYSVFALSVPNAAVLAASRSNVKKSGVSIAMVASKVAAAGSLNEPSSVVSSSVSTGSPVIGSMGTW